MTRPWPLKSLAALSLLAAVYGSLVPLRLRDDASWTSAATRLETLAVEPMRSLWTGDFFVNVLVLFPFGFFACGALSKTGARRAVVSAVVLSAGLAGMVEFAQFFVRDRTPSWSDVFALSLGGTAGAIAWAAIGPALTTGVSAATAAASPGARLRALLLLYSAGWIAVGLLPLLFPRYAYPLPRSVWLRFVDDPGPVMMAVQGLGGALAVAPVGAASALLTRNRRWWQRIALLLATGMAVLWLDGLRQITPGVTPPDVVPRLVGLTVGSWLLWSVAGRTVARDGVPAGRWAGMALAAWCMVLVVQSWAPFDFGVAPQDLALRVRILYDRVPLSRYYWAPPLLAVQIAFTVFLSAAPVGALLALWHRRSARVVSDGAAVVLSTALFAALEAGQLFLPAHRADPTDVFIAAAGAFIGVQLARAVAASRRPLPADS